MPAQKRDPIRDQMSAAYREYAKNPDLPRLINTAADIYGWNEENGRQGKIDEFLQEARLLVAKRFGKKFPELAFNIYARTINEHGCIPLLHRFKV